MRVFITVLVLIFSLQSWTKADDVSDFEIEGMSIGDSLLDYFSKEEIDEEKKHEYNYKNIFATIGFIKDYYKTYDKVQLDYKLNDINYKIYGIVGVILFDNKIKDCLNQKKEIVSVINSKIAYLKKEDQNKNHWADNTGNSKTYITYFDLNSGDSISVGCYDWSDEKTREKQWIDNLKVNISTKEFDDFMKDNF